MAIKFTEEQRLNAVKLYQEGKSVSEVEQLTGISAIDYLLTREDFESFIYESCYYCSEPPSLRNVNTCELVCNGIDRIDNSIGYIKANCITCCKLCNKMKSSMSEKEFTDHCCKVASRFVSGLVRFVDE